VWACCVAVCPSRSLTSRPLVIRAGSGGGGRGVGDPVGVRGAVGRVEVCAPSPAERVRESPFGAVIGEPRTGTLDKTNL